MVNLKEISSYLFNCGIESAHSNKIGLSFRYLKQDLYLIINEYKINDKSKFFSNFLEFFLERREAINKLAIFCLGFCFGSHCILGPEYFIFITKYLEAMSKLIEIAECFTIENQSSEIDKLFEPLENFVIEYNEDFENENSYWVGISKEKGKEEGKIMFKRTTLNDLKDEDTLNYDNLPTRLLYLPTCEEKEKDESKMTLSDLLNGDGEQRYGNVFFLEKSEQEILWEKEFFNDFNETSKDEIQSKLETKSQVNLEYECPENYIDYLNSCLINEYDYFELLAYNIAKTTANSLKNSEADQIFSAVLDSSPPVLMKTFINEKKMKVISTLQIYSSKISNIVFNENDLEEKITQTGTISKFIRGAKDLYTFVNQMQESNQIKLFEKNDLISKFIFTKILANTDSNPGNIIVKEKGNYLKFIFIDSRSTICCYEFDCILNFFKKITKLLKRIDFDNQKKITEIKHEILLHLTYKSEEFIQKWPFHNIFLENLILTMNESEFVQQLEIIANINIKNPEFKSILKKMDDTRKETMDENEWEEEEEDNGYKCRYSLYVPKLISEFKEAFNFFSN